jgi:hypothetical protein
MGHRGSSSSADHDSAKYNDPYLLGQSINESSRGKEKVANKQAIPAVENVGKRSGNGLGCRAGKQVGRSQLGERLEGEE